MSAKIVLIMFLLIGLLAIPGYGQDERASAARILPSPVPGSYPADISVDFESETGYGIEYRFLESLDPAYHKYIFPLELSALPGERRIYTVEARPVIEAGAAGGSAVPPVTRFTYVIDKQYPRPPQASLPNGLYPDTISVSFITDGRDEIFYSIDSALSDAARKWDGSALELKNTGQLPREFNLYAYSVDDAGNAGSHVSYSYLLRAAGSVRRERLDILSPVEGRFANTQLLALDSEGFEWIRYTVDGTDPTVQGVLYSEPLLIDKTGETVLTVAALPRGAAVPLQTVVRYEVVVGDDTSYNVRSGSYPGEVTVNVRRSRRYYYTFAERLPGYADIQYTQPVTIQAPEGGIKYVSMRFRSDESIDASGADYRFFFVLDDRKPSVPHIVLRDTPPLNTATRVEIFGSEKDLIYFSTDGSTPDISSRQYRGPFVLNLPDGSPSGSILVKAIAYSPNGNRSRVVSSLVPFDKSPPDIPKVTHRAPEISRGPVSFDIVTEYGADVVYEITFDGSEPADPGIGSARGSASMSLSVPYGMESICRIKVAAIDKAGNISPPTPEYRFILDRAPPPPPSAELSDGMLTITGSGVIRYTLTADGSLPEPAGLQSTRYLAPVRLQGAPGELTEYRVSVFAVDEVGNRSSYAPPRSLFVDRREPFLPEIRGLVNGASYARQAVLELAKHEPSIIIHYTITTDGSIPADPTELSDVFPPSMILEGEEGLVTEYRVKLKPVFVNGLGEGRVYDFVLYVDRDPPAVPRLSGFVNGKIYNSAVVIDAEEAYPDRITLSLDGGDPFGGRGLSLDGSMRLDVPYGAQVGYDLVVAAEDAAGNRTYDPTTYSFVIDKRPPKAPVLAAVTPGMTADGAVTIEIGSEEGEIRYSVGEEIDPGRPNTASSLYTGPIVLEGKEGREVRYTIRAVTFDNAGNISTTDLCKTVTVDRQPPDTPEEPVFSVSADGIIQFSWSSTAGRDVFYAVAQNDQSAALTYRLYASPVSAPYPTGSESLSVQYYAADLAGNRSPVRRSSIILPGRITGGILSGAENGAMYGNSIEIRGGTTSGIIRYEVTTGFDRLPTVSRFSPVLTGSLLCAAAPGETVSYAVHAALFADEKSEIVLARETIGFVIDRTPPEPPRLVEVPEGVGLEEDIFIKFEDTGDEIYYSINGGSFIRYRVPVRMNVPDSDADTFKISAYSKDGVGNRSAIDSEWTVYVDRNIIYVSPDGSDVSDGTRIRPYRTLGQALSTAARGVRKTIFLMEGSYFLNEPVTISEDMSIVGGFSGTAWKDPGTDAWSRIVAGSFFPPGKTLVTVSGRTVDFSNVAFESHSGETFRVSGGNLVVNLCRFSHSGGYPVIHQDGGVVSIDDSIIIGDGGSASLLSFRGGAAKIRDTRITSGPLSGGVPLVSALSSDDLVIETSLLEVSGGQNAVGLRTNDTPLRISSSSITVDDAAVSGTCLLVTGGEARIEGSELLGEKGNRISTGIQGIDTYLSISGSTISVEGRYGAAGMNIAGSEIYMSRSRIDSPGDTDEFMYIAVFEESRGAFNANIVNGGGTKDYIGVTSRSSEIDWFNNTFVHGTGTNVSVGFSLEIDGPVRIINNILVREGSGGDHGTAINVSGSDADFTLIANDLFGWSKYLEAPNFSADDVSTLNRAGERLRGKYGNNISEDPAVTFRAGDPDRRLNPESACVDAGFDVSLIGGIQSDYEGQPRPDRKIRGRSAYDIGADEYYPR